MSEEYSLQEAFRAVEDQLINSMTRNMKRHLGKESEEGISYAMWQTEQLKALSEYRKANKEKFGKYFSEVNRRIDAVIKQAYELGGLEQEAKILEAVKQGWKTSKNTKGVSGKFFRTNSKKLNSFAKSVTNDIKKAEYATLRQANDQYRKAIFNAGVYFNTGAGTLPQCIDMATKDFLSRGLTSIEYENGARVPLDSYAEMALRTANTRSYLQGEADKRSEWGVNTVLVGPRGAACPRCMPWTNRVYYDDVWGSVPVRDAKYPRLSSAIAGGLYHPNCRDGHTTYFEGVTTPPKRVTKADREEAERVYGLQQKQRYNESQIRKYKRLSNGSIFPENKTWYDDKVKYWQKRNREFIKENGDVLARHPEREGLRGITFPTPDNIDYLSSLSDGVLGNKPITISSVSSIKPFECETLTKERQVQLANVNKRLLTEMAKHPLGTEGAVCFTTEMERLTPKTIIGKAGSGSVKIPDFKTPYVLVHTHPDGETFSLSDINAFIKRDNLKLMLAVGNDGSVYALEKTKPYSKVKIDLCLKRLKTFYPKRLDSVKEYLDFINAFYREAKSCGVRYYAGRYSQMEG